MRIGNGGEEGSNFGRLNRPKAFLPNNGPSGLYEACRNVELPLANAVHEFDSGDGGSRILELLEAELDGHPLT